MFYRHRCFGYSVGLSLSALFTIYLYKTFSKKAVDDVQPVETEPQKTPGEIYLQKWSDQFTETFSHEHDVQVYNENIRQIFYLFDEYKSEIERSENTIEKEWKTRILYESTPRGNIVMYYDAYKRGFAYYADTSISYPFLNACAMKYVITFFCRDFFIDELYWPKGTHSPFYRLHLQDKKKALAPKNAKFDATKGPFAKLKNGTNKEAIPVRKSVKTETKKDTGPEKMQNKFLYLGKVCNFSFLKDKPDKTEKHATIPMNYGDFKSSFHWRSPKAEGGENHLFSGGGGSA
jgi:hypothetical protein